MSHTRELDWQPDAQPSVYKPVCKMVSERGITERQTYNRDRKLHALEVSPGATLSTSGATFNNL